MICSAYPTATGSSVNGSVDCVQVYLADIRPIGLLNVTQEIAIGKRALLFRNAFRNFVCKSVPALNYFLSLLGDVQNGKRRIDRVLTFSPNDNRQRQKFQRLLAVNVPTLRQLAQQRRHLADNCPKGRKQLSRNNAKVGRLLGELKIRQRFYVDVLSLLVAEAEPLTRKQNQPNPDQADNPRQLYRKGVQLLEFHKRACEELVQGNLRLVVSVAKKFTHFGYCLEDLIQDGNSGLLRAAQKYDYRRGIRFSTYATWWIREAILGNLSDSSRIVGIPSRYKATMRRLDHIHEDLYKRRGRTPGIEEVAVEAGIDTAFAERLLALRSQFSLDSPLHSRTQEPFRESLEDTRFPSAWQSLIRHEQVKKVRSMLRVLGAQEKTVIRLRFGLKDGQQRSLAEIGRELGLSRERIRQVHKNALDKMQSSKLRAI